MKNANEVLKVLEVKENLTKTFDSFYEEVDELFEIILDAVGENPADGELENFPIEGIQHKANVIKKKLGVFMNSIMEYKEAKKIKDMK